MSAEARVDSTHLQGSVEQVLASPQFKRSHRLSELLSYLAKHTSSSDLDSLKETVIGERVFHRSPQYNPAEDNIVRSNVHQLRLKLKEYYATAGASDPWCVTIPKGSYLLVLEERHRATERDAGNAASPAPLVSAGSPRRGARILWLATALIAGCLVAAIAFGIYLAVTPARAVKTGAPDSLLTLIAPHPGQRLLVVVPDANLQLYERLTGRTVGLQGYLKVRKQFAQPKSLQGLPPGMVPFADTTFAQSVTQSFVLNIIPRFVRAVPHSVLSIINPESLQMTDFESNNVALISGPNGDPWVRLFDRSLNFQIEAQRGSNLTHIVDRQPRPGEKDIYANHVDGSGTAVSYARVAYVPGLTPGSKVLLAGGPSDYSTESACRFLTGPSALAMVRGRFHVAPNQQIPYFELLIETRALQDSPWEADIVAARIVPAK